MGSGRADFPPIPARFQKRCDCADIIGSAAYVTAPVSRLLFGRS